MNDNSKMPFGRYKGEAMGNVPSDYLLYIYENMNIFGGLKEYIEENMDVIKADIERKQKIRNETR